jgi:hypothetical protein
MMKILFLLSLFNVINAKLNNEEPPNVIIMNIKNLVNLLNANINQEFNGII